jgi:hypothetical protein
MSTSHATSSSLSDERNNVIAHALAEKLIGDAFRLDSESDYRRKLGQAAADLGHDITADELHQFILNKLPKRLGRMFGWRQCGITGSDRRY